MTKTHATGAGMQYGMRYLLKFSFNVAVGEDDDDGNAASYREPSNDAYQGADMSEPNPIRPPQSKSAKKQEAPGRATNPLGLKRAPSVDDKISPSNIKTLQSQMKHHKIADSRFREVMGFPLEDANRSDLNSIIGWIKEEAR